MKQLVEFFPLLAFFIAYYLTDLLTATAVLVGLIIVQVVYKLIRYRRLDNQFAITAAVIVVLGGITLWFQDPLFIMWKPTVVSGALAALLVGSHWLGRRNAIQYLLGGVIQLPDADWRVINFVWAAVFLISAVLNLWVVYTFSESVWVNFKVFGLTGIHLVTALIMGVWMMPRQLPSQ